MDEGVAQSANGSYAITLGWMGPQFLPKIADMDVQTPIQRGLVAEETLSVKSLSGQWIVLCGHEQPQQSAFHRREFDSGITNTGLKSAW